MTSISLRIDELDYMLVKKFSEVNDETVSGYIRRVINENLKGEYDKLMDDFTKSQKWTKG